MRRAFHRSIATAQTACIHRPLRCLRRETNCCSYLFETFLGSLELAARRDNPQSLGKTRRRYAYLAFEYTGEVRGLIERGRQDTRLTGFGPDSPIQTWSSRIRLCSDIATTTRR